jgi:antitoxin component HigA of HigAB toxin-antitoxin module
MFTKTLRRDGYLGELMAAFPLARIEDEFSYSRAIEILDRLFLLNREKNREESEYFRVLAEFASEYESQRFWDERRYTG